MNRQLLLLACKIGLLTAVVIIFFEVLNLFTLYQYIKLDYYLAFVAICFLLAGWWIRKPSRPKGAPAPVQRLTTREQEILRLIIAGKTNKEIAAAHYVEISTVKTHINNIYSKLSVSNRQEAKAKYAEMAEKQAFS